MTDLVRNGKCIQYCCRDYVSLFEDHKVAISMTQNGDPCANALAEHINRTIKPVRPLGLWAGNIPRFGSLPEVNQSGVHYRAAEESKTYASIQSPLCSNCLRLG